MISVIVPVYNTEKYLPRCIDSILVQTYKDFELLLIDDGSTDNSGAICDEYAKKDERIHVFHKENGGVSMARNLGLDNAKGEYILFVDSDDWLELGIITEKIFEGEYDVIRIPCNRCYPPKLSDKEVICSTYKEVIKYLEDNFCNSCCFYIYRNNVINSNRFVKNLRMGEDAIFNVDVLSNAKTLHDLGGDKGYNYFMNNESAVSKLTPMADMKLLLRNLLNRQFVSKKLIWNILFNTCYIACNNYQQLYIFYAFVNFIDIIRAPIGINKKRELLIRRIKYKIECVVKNI